MTEIPGGYRLDYLEFYNWGTFDGRTARIVPGCQSSLMTGANGSGKTTVVDALLTLLVPNQKRFYNQSSGAEQKRDRTEESYVLGEIGKTRDEEDQEARKKYLRPDRAGVVSFLLGCFHNPETGTYVTLVQTRWFSSTELKRALIVSPHQLSLDKDIMPFDKHGDWRKRLKNTFSKTEISDSFSQYSQEFMRLFNMRSEKALTLFNQTVGIKVLGNLNDFVRTHMLEDGQQEAEFQKLYANYLDLLETYRNLQKAEEQIRLLKPVIDNCQTHQELKQLLDKLDTIKDAIPFYFSEQEIGILETLIEDTKGELRQQEETVKQKEEDKERQESTLKALQSSIDKNQASAAIKEIDTQINTLGRDLDRKQTKAEEYNALALQLSYKKLSSKEIFDTNQKRIEQDLSTTKKDVEHNKEKEVEKRIELQGVKEDAGRIEEELKSLKGRKNRIPLENITLRQRMLEALDLTVEDIPFAGELIRVRQDEKNWESAIERLLRNFGLRLLVPEKHLKAVNTYVHKTQLKGKIVYDKVYRQQKPGSFYNHEDVITIKDKVELKEEAADFLPYLEREFADHLNHICADTQDEFTEARKALMISGLSKNGDRHEKDDRANRVTPDKYILGWDNKEQIRLLEGKLKQTEATIEEINREIEKLKKESAALDKQKEQIQKLTHYNSYLELNWQDDQQTIEELASKKEKLSKESGLKELIKQRDELAGIIKMLSTTINAEIEKKGALKDRIKQFGNDVEGLKNNLQPATLNKAKESYTNILPYLMEEEQLPDPLKKIRTQRDKTRTAIEDEHKKKSKDEGQIRARIISSMAAFTSPAEKIRQDFPDWSKDTVNLSASMDYIDDFKRLYERITEEDLPKHKKDFKEYMKDSVTSRITSFKTELDNRKEEIEDHIEQLNKSLNKIDFNTNPHTYIQLRAKPAKDQEIRTFKSDLANCIVAAADIELAKNDDWVETAFKNIHTLIEKLKSDDNRRKRLIDVRNWMDFEAEEYFRETNKRRKTLDSSDSLSGGEKAQFTYTILGAAIAFQFGISESSPKANSFRFIAVDEAFSKLDPEKSRYLMALCEQLQLQIMVVTPLDKIYVAEEYIASCHFVEKQSTDRSKVYNLTMPQYYEQKKLWESQASVS